MILRRCQSVLPRACAVGVGSKPLELQKQLLQHVPYDELVEASTSTLAPTSRVVKDVAERHLLSGRRRRRLRRRVEDIRTGHRAAMRAILQVSPQPTANDTV